MNGRFEGMAMKSIESIICLTSVFHKSVKFCVFLTQRHDFRENSVTSSLTSDLNLNKLKQSLRQINDN